MTYNMALPDVERAVVSTTLMRHATFTDIEKRVAYVDRIQNELWNQKSVAYLRRALVSAGTAGMAELLDKYARQ